MSAHHLIARHLVITGRVQGVGFRWWTAGAARAAGVTGWVRNRADGAVEIVIEGEAAAIEAFVRDCADGPAAARVDVVKVSDVQVGGLNGFEQRPTA